MSHDDIPQIPARFIEKIAHEPNTGCWLWTAVVKRGGYGQFWWNGRMGLAHRFAYETLVGEVPDGLVLDHFVCSTPECVNPAHLRPVTAHANHWRRKGANRNSRTGIRGVSLHRSGHQARVTWRRREHYLGGYATLAEAGAAIASARAIIEGWGRTDFTTDELRVAVAIEASR